MACNRPRGRSSSAEADPEPVDALRPRWVSRARAFAWTAGGNACKHQGHSITSPVAAGLPAVEFSAVSGRNG
eukprot:295969-Lingulodinium_polyedra.AAC.1